MIRDYDPYIDAQATDRSAQVIQIESSKLMPIIVLLSILCGTAIGLTAFSFNSARKNEVETRMLEYYILEVDGKLINAGIIRPEESWSSRKQKEKSQ